MRNYWVIVDEQGKLVDNVTYIDKPEAVAQCQALNDTVPRTRLDKFYRLRGGYVLSDTGPEEAS